MSGFVIQPFLGIAPRLGARLLQNGQAQVASNCRLTSGYLNSINQSRLVVNPGVAGIQSIFRLSGSNWLAWSSDVDVARSQVANDTSNRFYYTGDGEPRVSDLGMAISGSPAPFACYVLGVFPPSKTPTLSHAGGVGTAISRAFVYTFVNQVGEESQPSLPSPVTVGKVDGTWTIGNMDVAPANTFTVTGATWSSGVATFTVSSTFGLRVGEEIGVASVVPSAYNVTKAAISSLTSTTVSIAMASNPGAWTSGGTITRKAPHNTASMKKRIYWTETTATGTDYRFVKEIDASLTSDTVAGNTTSVESLPSATWAMIPVDAKGIIAHPAGFYVAFRNNEVLVSEAGIPYAWPIAYRQPSDFKIVGLGLWGATIVVCTEGMPYNLTGVDPATLSMTRIDKPWPCLSKRGIASSESGVAFPTAIGVVASGASGDVVLTNNSFTKETFADYSPSSFIGANYAGRYVASFTNTAGIRQLLVIDPSDPLAMRTASISTTEVWGDQTTGELYVVIDDAIYQFEAETGQKVIYDWMSKEVVTQAKVALTSARVDAKFTMTPEEVAAAIASNAAAVAANNLILAGQGSLAAMNDDELNDLELCGTATQIVPPLVFDSLNFLLYANGVLKFSRRVTDSKSFRIGGGANYKEDRWAIRLQGNVEVRSVAVAETIPQLNLV